MKAINLFQQKNIKDASRPRNKSTAYYIFDKDNRYPFSVDLVHHRMKTGNADGAIVYSGKRQDLERTLHQLVPVMGTIIEMSDYYRHGATLHIEEPETARDIYDRILHHLSAHLTAMQTDVSYELPEDDTLEELAEFGAAIYGKAQQVGKKEGPRVDTYINRLRMARPFISFDKPAEEVHKEPEVEVPSVIKKMDAIQQYISMNQLR